MSNICPVCGNSVEQSDPICASCGFKLLGSTQKFEPLNFGDEPIDVQEKPAGHVLLRVVRGPQTSIAFTLTGDGPFSVGRSPQCDIFLNDMTVSRLHATITRAGKGYAISDEHSFNGVWINNENVDATRALATGDIIQIGAFCLLYQEERG